LTVTVTPHNFLTCITRLTYYCQAALEHYGMGPNVQSRD